MDLSNRTAVVTGATAGIGTATARALHAAGASVALVGRREERLQALATELGERAVAIPADVARPDGPTDRVHEALGPVDLVVANAGVMLGAPFEEADPDEWRQMLDVNVGGLLATGRAFIGDLLAAAKLGRPADLVHVGSVGGHQSFPNYGVYCATKAAVEHLTRTLRLELGPRGVRVKSIEPGLVTTELGDGMQHGATRDALQGMRAALEPLDPAAIADAIVYAVGAPPNVNVADMVVVPVGQG
jgi:NADP-dependent 3-hydroxy acid dehydrogenase YdfG